MSYKSYASYKSYKSNKSYKLNLVMANFLKISGDYTQWNVYRKSVIICDVTEMFINRALPRGSRTIDQMRQAARSSKQNIVEGLAMAAYLLRCASNFLTWHEAQPESCWKTTEIPAATRFRDLEQRRRTHKSNSRILHKT